MRTLLERKRGVVNRSNVKLTALKATPVQVIAKISRGQELEDTGDEMRASGMEQYCSALNSPSMSRFEI